MGSVLLSGFGVFSHISKSLDMCASAVLISLYF